MITRNPKPSRAAAFSMLQDLRKRDTLTASDKRIVESLLIYFASNQTITKPKNALDWVRVACAKNDLRDYLNYIAVFNGTVIASNGHSARMIDNSGYFDRDGLYNATTLIRHDEYSAENNIVRLFRDTLAGLFTIPYREAYYPVNLTYRTETIRIGKKLEERANFHGSPYRYNLGYLRACAGSERKIECGFFDATSCSFILRGECEFGMFVVMPIVK